MTSPSPDLWPDDADGLARLAADAGRTDRDRRRAFDALLPTIRRVVLRLAVRFTGQPRDDLEADALGDVWGALPRCPPDVRFEPWCYTVLRNRQRDQLRHEQVERRHAEAAARQRPEAGELSSALDRACADRSLLHPADLLAVADWPLRYRLVLLCVSGLYAKVPAADWESWVNEHRRAYGVPDDGPFPPAAFQQCDDIRQRNDLLAVALKVRRNTLSVWLHRGKSRLLGLRYVVDLLPPPAEGEPQP